MASSATSVVSITFLCWSVMATPVRTIDGDSFVADLRIFMGQTNRETVRVLGVNTPEMKGPTREAGEAARGFTATWLDGAELRLHVCSRDAFGRVLATVHRARDGANLTTDLLAGGYGVKR
jgi:endonuclease YncB( thermonuclease family)